MLKYFRLMVMGITLSLSVSGQSAPNSFLSNQTKSGYFTFELTKNSPTIHTKAMLKGRHATYYFGYRNLVSDTWMMGLGFNYKSFSRIKTNEELSFLTLQHESFRIIRLYHPLYLLIGPRILYLMPTRQSTLPVNRDPDFETEIGAGMTVMLQGKIDQKHLFTVRVDRWRGTKTNKFHGYEVAMGINRKL